LGKSFEKNEEQVLQKKIEKIKRKIPDAGPAHRCQRG
jgi:hypothetical protein